MGVLALAVDVGRRMSTIKPYLDIARAQRSVVEGWQLVTILVQEPAMMEKNVVPVYCLVR
jgi:hypothetical protein